MNNTSGKFPSVLGYISEPERISLQRCVLDTSHIPGDALEVGSLNGLSALLILSVLESSKTLICVEKGETTSLGKNLWQYELLRQSKLLQADFKELTLPDEMNLSFCFIDHDHTYENTIAAFNKFWPCLSPGGIMSFHDYGHPDYSGGSKAIGELMEQHSLRHADAGGSFIAFKKP